MVDDEVYTQPVARKRRTRRRPPVAGRTDFFAPLARLLPLKLPALGFDGGAEGAPPMPAMPSMERMEGMPGMPDGGAGEEAEEAAGPSGPATRSTVSRSGLGLKAMNTARREIGAREEPKGSNRGPQVDRYTGGQAQPWCCHFVSWCVEQNGKSPFGHLASVASLREWGKKSGRYVAVGGAEPKAGDIFTMARYDKNGQLVGGHTGFVERYDPRTGKLHTIEGNTSDQVEQRSRSMDVLDGFIAL